MVLPDQTKRHRYTQIEMPEQRIQKQSLCLMFIYKTRHDDIRHIYAHNTRGAYVYSFVREHYNNMKYKTVLIIKGHLYGIPYQ